VPLALSQADKNNAVSKIAAVIKPRKTVLMSVVRFI